MVIERTRLVCVCCKALFGTFLPKLFQWCLDCHDRPTQRMRTDCHA